MRTTPPYPRPLALAAALALLVAGCAGRTDPTNVAEDTSTRLGDTAPVSLADWLGKSRAELAVLAEDWAATVAKQREAAQARPESLELLPALHVPVGVPVLNAAVYSPALKLSLPPYLKEGGFDTELAFHLARHGDAEAGLRLADPADAAARARLEALAGGRHYPVEWVRLVALAQQSATFKMATGDVEGATLLVHLHRQLRELLDEKAAAGPLGQVLLPRGKNALTAAAVAWKGPGQNKPSLAADVEAAVAEWGPVPAPVELLPPGTDRKAVLALLGGQADGHAVTVVRPEALARALDLLALPVCPEGVESLAAFFDDKDGLNSLLFVYRDKVESLYPEPADLAYRLLEQGARAGEVENGPRLLRQGFTLGDRAYEATRLLRGNGPGALVRVSAAGAPAVSRPSLLGRDFGPVGLDRSFEAGRVAVARDQAGTLLTVGSERALAALAAPARLPAPNAALVQREAGYDLPASLTFRWPATENAVAGRKLLPSLWAAFGTSTVEGVEDATGGFTQFTWADADTRVRLRLPAGERPAELVVEDARGPKALAARAEAAVAREAADRKARIAEGQPRDRLDRAFETVGGLPFGFARLGRPRAEVERELPKTTLLRKRAIPGGLSLFFTGNPPAETPFWARQMFILFDERGRVGEVRVRYSEAGKPGKPDSLLGTLQAGAAGKPETVPAEWAGLWRDLPEVRAGTVKYRWADDETVVTYQSDGDSSEVIRRDRPLDRPEGTALTLTALEPGVGKCLLGASHEDVLKAMKTAADPASGAEAFRLPAESPYAYGMFWTRDGKVSKVIAEHRARPEANAKDVTAAIALAWARDRDRLGYVCRVEGADGQVLASYFWHDDRTRVRIFVQDTQEGPRLFTEWQPWPLPERKAAVASR